MFNASRSEAPSDQRHFRLAQLETSHPAQWSYIRVSGGAVSWNRRAPKCPHLFWSAASFGCSSVKALRGEKTPRATVRKFSPLPWTFSLQVCTTRTRRYLCFKSCLNATVCDQWLSSALLRSSAHDARHIEPGPAEEKSEQPVRCARAVSNRTQAPVC